VLLEVDGLRIAVVGFTGNPAGFAAGPGQPGVAYAELAAGFRALAGQVQALATSNDVLLVPAHQGQS